MRLIIAECSVDYAGRLSAHLPRAKRLLVMKADGSVLVHSDSGSYKPLNWMNPPCTVTVLEPNTDQIDVGVQEVWQVQQAKTDDVLMISIFEVISDISHELGEDPGLIKDGVEKHLQELLADFTIDWDNEFEGTMGRDTRLLADLHFESIDIIQLVVAIEEMVGRRKLPFDKLLMKEGRYVDDLSIGQIADFLSIQL
mgnify:CR=1 FL=1